LDINENYTNFLALTLNVFETIKQQTDIVCQVTSSMRQVNSSSRNAVK